MRLLFPHMPVITLCDHTSNLVPEWGHLSVVKTRPAMLESHTTLKTRDHEVNVMPQMGVLDAWRNVFAEPEDKLGVGATREQRWIDRILISQSVCSLVKAVFTTPVGRSNHTAVSAKVCSSLPSQPSNTWRFPSYLLHNDMFNAGTQSVFQESEGLLRAV